LKKNKIEFEGDLMYLYPTNKPDVKFTLDREDYDKIKDYCWSMAKGEFLKSYYNKKYIKLTDLLLGDFIDNNYIVYNDDNNFNLCKNNIIINNKIEIYNDYIILYSANTKDKYIIDIDDYEKIKKYRWNVGTLGIINSCINNKNISLKQFIKPYDNKYNIINFIDNNIYNYRKNNLIICQKNNFNKPKSGKIIIFPSFLIAIPDNTNNKFIFPLEMLEIFKKYSFFESDKNYLKLSIDSKKYFAHHFVIGNPLNKKYFVVDHINRNTYFNLKYNLRIVPKGFNNQNKNILSNNKTGFIGVKKFKTKWNSCIGYKNKEITIGCYKNIIDAAKAYDKKALELYGENAITNEKLGRYEIYYNKNL